ncbi:unnamed protein product [Lota lota]
MGVIADIFQFAKEILSHRPCRSLLKIYLLGSTLALLGVAGVLVETILLPFLEGRPQKEDSDPEFIFMETMMDDKKQPLKTQTVISCW